MSQKFDFDLMIRIIISGVSYTCVFRVEKIDYNWIYV